MKLVFFLCSTLLTTSLAMFDSLLDKWENAVDAQDRSLAQLQYTQLKDAVADYGKMSRTDLRRLYRVYGMYLMYGLDEDYAGYIDYARVKILQNNNRSTTIRNKARNQVMLGPWPIWQCQGVLNQMEHSIQVLLQKILRARQVR